MYKITVTKKQAEVICAAVELITRLGIGQWREIMEYLPLKRDYETYHEDLDIIGKFISRHTIDGVDGWRSSLSIHYHKVDERSKVGLDLYQVLRHRLSWDKAVADGKVESLNSPRNPVCGEPLAKIEKDNK